MSGAIPPRAPVVEHDESRAAVDAERDDFGLTGAEISKRRGSGGGSTLTRSRKVAPATSRAPRRLEGRGRPLPRLAGGPQLV